MITSEVDEHRKSIKTDSYSMSIGEIVNMYRDEEITIQPEFQRIFRWSIEKQSRLIESILLGLPIPPVFVSQKEDGTWELIDGLQRMSTILKFMGELKDSATGKPISAEPLTRTKYLPSMEGMTWEASGKALPNPLKIDFKRSRIQVQILQRESDRTAKYEMFDRLNSGGEITSPQEVRSAMIQMEDMGFYNWIDSLRRSEEFGSCIAMTARRTNEQYDLELVIRFLVLSYDDPRYLQAFPDMDALLTENILLRAKDARYDRVKIENEFRSVFRILGVVGPEVFRKYDDRRMRSIGPFSVAAFEAITQGMHKHLGEWQSVEPADLEDLLLDRVKELWKNDRFTRNSGGGVRPTQRIPHMRAAGEEVFQVSVG